MLAERTKAWKERNEKMNYNDTSRLLTQLKKQKEYEFLRNVSSVPVQQTLRHLDRAFVNFFAKRAKYPRFRRKGGHQSAEFTRSAFSLEKSDEPILCPDGKYRHRKVLRLARMKDPIYVIWHRPLPPGALPSTATLSRTPNNQYFVSFFVETEFVPLPKNDKKVGIDFGVRSVVVTSDGEVFGNPQFFDKEEKKLARLQRKLSKTKGVKNKEKARRAVAKKHAQIAYRRSNYQHHISKRIIEQYGEIVIETLNIKGMVKNRHLSRAISNVGWGELGRQLAYKAEWYGRTVTKIDTFYPSSKTCHKCKYVMDELPLEIREWQCPNCGTLHDRDINAAINVRDEGMNGKVSHQEELILAESH